MKKSIIRTTLLGVAAVASMAFSTQANAAVVGTVVGTGTLDPGIPTTGCAVQTDVVFTGTAVGVGDVTGVFPIAFSGNGTTCDTLLTGAGVGTLNGRVSGDVSYSRIGAVVTLSGSGSVDGGPEHAIIAAACGFVPTSVNPIVSYALNCNVALS